VLGSVGAIVVAGAGTYGVIAAGFTLIPTTIFVVGWVFVLTMAFDFPIASRFTRAGVERRMFLRRHHIPWSEVEQLTRTRPTMIKIDRRLEHGSLAAKRGRRRYLLVDRLESAAEFDRVVDIVEAAGSDGEHVGVSMLPRPGEKVPPTWLYRRAAWRPDHVERR
jgi:hypothetical protein